ncbi:EAL domain-containing protein [Achromobacter sp. AGC25]
MPRIVRSQKIGKNQGIPKIGIEAMTLQQSGETAATAMNPNMRRQGAVVPSERRKRNIAIMASALAISGVLVPLMIASHLAREQAEEAQLLRLNLVAGKVAERANIALSQARNALDTLTIVDDQPCHDDHVTLMRRLTLNTLSIEEITYNDGTVACTTWRDSTPLLPESSFELTPDTRAFVGARSAISGAAPMLGIQRAPYLVLINLSRFTDIQNPHAIQTAFMRVNGPVLAVSPGANTDALLATLQTDVQDPALLASSVEFGGWRATAAGPHESPEELWHQRLLLFPLGALFSGLIVWLIYKLSRARLSQEAELLLALKQREFFVNYQPIIELATGKCAGAEALVRWRRPDGEIIAPDNFIPLAEKCGLISAISMEVIRQAMDDLAALLTANPGLHLAINFSAIDLSSTQILDCLSEKLAQSKIGAGQIWIELTERDSIDPQSVSILELARSRGFGIAIDDFGTGYSSLAYLNRLPAHTLKIDRAFVHTIETDSVSAQVLPHIIELAHSHSFLIVAEGVETPIQAAYLRAKGVQYAQGWLFSRPLSAADFLKFVGSNPDTAFLA